MKGKWDIVSNEPIAARVYQMVLRGDTTGIRPGQFVEIAVPGLFLRRPISVCNVEDDLLTIIYKIVGQGTAVMAQMQQGTQLDILTCLGNGYNLTKARKDVLLIGGGVGVPPLVYLAKQLREQGKNVHAVLGFNTRDEVLIPFDYSDIDCLSADRYLVENEKLSAIVDVNNKDVGTNNFIAVSLVDNGLISSNFFNAIKSASYLCDSFNTEECCGYKAGTKLSDNKTWLAEVNKYVHVYGKRKSFTSMDVDDYARPIRTYHFDKFLSHEKYEYYYGYRLYDGRAATPSATLIYIEIEQSVMDYPKTAEQQFVDAMRIVLPERGFIDNGKGVFISDKGTAVTFGYNSGEIVVYYFFTSSDAISAPIVPREDKTE